MAEYEIYSRWQGRPVVPSRTASRELEDEEIDLDDVLQVLEEGIETGEKRAEGVVEKCLAHGNRSIKVVVVQSYNFSFEMDCWLVIHVKSVKIK